jgi:diguanylate cyclase (GGDEF)-like protein/PAS domain S-box-containing protein
MVSKNKTKKQLMTELAELQEKLYALEGLERTASQAQRDFGEKMGRYFLQMEHMNEAIYVIFDRKYEYINDKFSEMFGVTQEEVCSPDFDPMTLVAPESRHIINDNYRRGHRGEFRDHQYEFTGMKKDGASIECAAFVLFIPYKWGVAIHGMLRDVSVRKRIDEELRRHRSDLQIVLNSIPTSIFYTDREHRFIRANQAFCKSIGLPMDEIIGKDLTELFPNLPQEQLSHFYEASNKVMSSGKAIRGFIEIFPSIRGRRWIQNDRIPYRDEDGNIIGVICLAVDISDFHETEEKLWYLSFHDVLTGLYNRTYFEEELIRLENGRQFPISIIIIKLDDLQSVNDRDGITAGNHLLQRTAQIMKIFRADDVVARISGDRFAALLPIADKTISENSIARLRDALEMNNKRHSSKPLHLSFAAVTEEKKCSLTDVLKQKEDAMV